MQSRKRIAKKRMFLVKMIHILDVDLEFFFLIKKCLLHLIECGILVPPSEIKLVHSALDA